MKLKLLVSIAALLVATACSRTAPRDTGTENVEPTGEEQQSQAPAGEITELGVEAVATGLEAGTLIAVDANGDDARGHFGSIPNSILLTTYDSYAESELPTGYATHLVFYCSNEACSAAPAAAARAQEFGYQNVSVMHAGIMGWQSAGMDTVSVDVPEAEAAAEDAWMDAVADIDVTPAEVHEMIAAGAAIVCDTNRASTRTEFGMVPGALALTGAEFAVDELPEDTSSTLVFYCGGSRCQSAPRAAARAIEHGYTNVAVMREGIRGWIAEGYDVQAP